MAEIRARGPDSEGSTRSERAGGREVESGELEPVGGHGNGDEVDSIWFETGLTEQQGDVAAVFEFDGEESGPVGEVAEEGFSFGAPDHLFACVAADPSGGSKSGGPIRPFQAPLPTSMQRSRGPWCKSRMVS